MLGIDVIQRGFDTTGVVVAGNRLVGLVEVYTFIHLASSVDYVVCFFTSLS